MRLQELLPSYQLHPGDGQGSLDRRSPDPRPSCLGLLTLLPSPPVWASSSSRAGRGVVAPSWGSLPARSPSLNLFCSGASSSLLCRPSLPPLSLSASSGLPGGLAMAPGGGSRCLVLGIRKEAGASRSKRPRGGSGASALGLRVRAGQLCTTLLARHRPLLAIMGTACGQVNPVRPLKQVPSGQPLRQSHVSPNALGRKVEEGRSRRLGEDGQHSYPCLWLCLCLEWFEAA